MYFTDLAEYVGGLDTFLDKLEVKSAMDESGKLIVLETKETYIYEDEGDADKKINEARQDIGFLEAKKKFKQGKANKNGEITRPDTWTVVIKLSH